MRIQRTTDYPDTSTTLDYPDEKKIQQTRQKQKNNNGRSGYKIQSTTDNPGFKQQRTIRMNKKKQRTMWIQKTTTDNPGYKEQERTIRIQKTTTTHDPNTKSDNNARSGCKKTDDPDAQNNSGRSEYKEQPTIRDKKKTTGDPGNKINNERYRYNKRK